MKNIVTGCGLLILVGSFVVQRDYKFPHTNLLPDATLVILGVLSLVLVVMGVRQRSLATEGAVLSAEEEEEALSYKDLGRAVLLMAAWVLSMQWLGFLVASIVFFTLISVTMREGRITIRQVLIDTAIATGFVLFLYFAFTQVLYVRLPQLGGM